VARLRGTLVVLSKPFDGQGGIYSVVEGSVLLIRRHRVMLDTDLAKLHATSTKRLNEQAKRNRDRFPCDFMFQLTKSANKKGRVEPRRDRKEAVFGIDTPALPHRRGADDPP